MKIVIPSISSFFRGMSKAIRELPTTFAGWRWERKLRRVSRRMHRDMRFADEILDAMGASRQTKRAFWREVIANRKHMREEWSDFLKSNA